MKMAFLKMKNIFCLLYLFKEKIRSLLFHFSFRYSPSLCWMLTEDSSRCCSTCDMQVAISSFPSWPGGLKAFLNNENRVVVVLKAELEPQTSCRFVPLALQKQVQPCICALSTGTPCRHHILIAILILLT